MRDKAVRFLEAAGDAAATLYSNREAFSHYQSARDLDAGADPDSRARIAEKQGDAVGQVTQAYRLVLQREPAAEEGADFARYVSRHGLAAVYARRLFVTAGGLISYGPDSIDPHRRAATYVDRFLKGEKPADLPVQQATKVELIINLKTAKALGLTVPLPLLGRADEVVE